MSNSQCDFDQFVEMIFKRYYLSLRAYSFRFLNNREEADDVVQEVFLELVQKRETLCLDERGVKSYLFTAVYHRSLNHLNQIDRNRTLSIAEVNEDQNLSSYLSSFYGQQSEESILMANELGEAIKRCVDEFPAQRRRVFQLSRTYQLKNREIAQQLGISDKAVEKHLRIALSALQIFLSREGFYLIFYLISAL